MRIIKDLVCKKSLIALPLIVCMGMAGTASANSVTYSDFYDAGIPGVGGVKLGAWSGVKSDSWQFNISDNHGFDTATHTVTSASISMNLRDDKDQWWSGVFEFARLTAGGVTSAKWEVDTGTVILSVDSLISLNFDGTLDVTLTAVWGDFIFDDATLTANTSVVPVPAAVWLFGSGLLGLVGVARRKRQT